jgi:methyltransferase-like protein/cyclopropane fatty-acyl-phospholipid synthase-like methyltransferase
MSTASPPTRYDEVAYPSYAHSQTHPDQLATKAALFGMSPAPVDRCRVLELGCGDGTNLASMALGLSQSEFVGIDLSASAVAQGQEMARGVGLKNLSLRAMSVMDLGGDLGQFDYIIAHGLYSWVPAAVREKILAICRANLAPQGVAYISYNAKPGGHLKQMFREMMLFHTKGFANPKERVHQSIALVKFLAESQTRVESYRRLIQDELEQLLLRNENNIFHDELGEINDSFFFHDFCETARRHGLQYLAEGDYAQMRDHNYAAPVREALRQLGKNRVAREQYLDFLSGRRFRQTLLCHAELPLRFGFPPDVAARFHVSCMARPVSPNPDLASDASEKFSGGKDANIELNLPLAKAALAVLAEIWPRAMAFPELVAQARTRIGRPSASGGDDSDTLVVFEMLVEIYAPGLATLHVSPPTFAQGVSERPLASPLARWLARTTGHLPNLCHAPVTLEHPSGRHLLTLLDGTRDRAMLAREMRVFLEDSRRNSTGEAQSALPSDAELEGNIANTLEVFARCALLTNY